MEAGLHRLAIAAPGRRAWQGEVAIIAGQVLDLGRIDLALPPPAALRAAAAPAAPGTDNAGAPAAPPVVARTAPPARLRSGLLGTLVLLPAGKYLQGSDRREQGRRANEVQREVTLTRAFYLADTEVTNAQFRAFRASHASGIALDQSLDLDRQAVTGVSWADAVEFCNWLSLREGLPAAYERRDGRWQLVEPRNTGYRLPTEAEWEYAARGLESWIYPWGNEFAAENVVYNDNQTADVGSRPGGASWVGALDLSGNVWEWVTDWYEEPYPAQSQVNPAGPASGEYRIWRGGSYLDPFDFSSRATTRGMSEPSYSTNLIGFRCARASE
jgi:formylglycine-generating enzyme required for sulfatase activity